MHDLSQLKNLLKFLDDDALIRDIAKVKQVRYEIYIIHVSILYERAERLILYYFTVFRRIR